MTAIEMVFPGGRFHATPWGRHVNEGAVEWPPSSWRLLRSLVAAFYRTRPAGVDERDVRRIVAALSAPPSFVLPPASTAHTRHYDVANGSVKFFDTFVAVNPQAAVVWLWPDVRMEGEDARALDALLANLTTFGRSESWCEAWRVEGVPLEAANCAPIGRDALTAGLEPVRVLVPDATGDELFDALLVETSAMRKSKRLDPAGARWVTYRRPARALAPRTRVPRREPGQAPAYVAARFALGSSLLPRVQGGLALAELLRQVICGMRGGQGDHSPALTGKDADGVPLTGHGHAYYLPTDEDGDGKLDHVTIFAHGGFDAADVEVLGQIRSLPGGKRHHDIRLVLTALLTESDVETARSERSIPILGESARWRSITPFSLPRYASGGRGRSPRARDLPEAQLQRELELRGLPTPLEVIPLRLRESGDRPPIPWLDFGVRRRDGSGGHGLAGFELEFAEPVAGPLALGFGCHFGLGLFEPV